MWIRDRSFVKRAGRITSGQTKAFETLGPSFLLPYQSNAIDLEAAFTDATSATGINDVKPHAVVLEIGFGMGEATAHTVSYTHLDVYKRQSRWHSNPGENQ